MCVLLFPMGPNGLHSMYSDDVGIACASIFANNALKNDNYKGQKAALPGVLLATVDDNCSSVSWPNQTFPNHKLRYNNLAPKQYLKDCQAAEFCDAFACMYSFYVKEKPDGGDLVRTKKLNPKVNLT